MHDTSKVSDGLQTDTLLNTNLSDRSEGFSHNFCNGLYNRNTISDYATDFHSDATANTVDNTYINNTSKFTVERKINRDIIDNISNSSVEPTHQGNQSFPNGKTIFDQDRQNHISHKIDYSGSTERVKPMLITPSNSSCTAVNLDYHFTNIGITPNQKIGSIEQRNSNKSENPNLNIKIRSNFDVNTIKNIVDVNEQQTVKNIVHNTAKETERFSSDLIAKKNDRSKVNHLPIHRNALPVESITHYNKIENRTSPPNNNIREGDNTSKPQNLRFDCKSLQGDKFKVKDLDMRSNARTAKNFYIDQTNNQSYRVDAVASIHNTYTDTIPIYKNKNSASTDDPYRSYVSSTSTAVDQDNTVSVSCSSDVAAPKNCNENPFPNGGGSLCGYEKVNFADQPDPSYNMHRVDEYKRNFAILNFINNQCLYSDALNRNYGLNSHLRNNNSNALSHPNEMEEPHRQVGSDDLDLRYYPPSGVEESTGIANRKFSLIRQNNHNSQRKSYASNGYFDDSCQATMKSFQDCNVGLMKSDFFQSTSEQEEYHHSRNQDNKIINNQTILRTLGNCSSVQPQNIITHSTSDHYLQSSVVSDDGLNRTQSNTNDDRAHYADENIRSAAKINIHGTDDTTEPLHQSSAANASSEYLSSDNKTGNQLFELTNIDKFSLYQNVSSQPYLVNDDISFDPLVFPQDNANVIPNLTRNASKEAFLVNSNQRETSGCSYQLQDKLLNQHKRATDDRSNITVGRSNTRNSSSNLTQPKQSSNFAKRQDRTYKFNIRRRNQKSDFSCTNCKVKQTPQWRYFNGIPVCNACYMRARKLINKTNIPKHRLKYIPESSETSLHGNIAVLTNIEQK